MTNRNSEKKLSSELGKELVNKGFDTSLDYAEIFIDSFNENEILKEIPIVKTVFTSINIVNTIRDKANLKKLLVFLREFHKNELSNKDFEKFKNKFNNDKKYRERVIEHILIIVDRINGTDKSKVFANLFTNHINKNIDWERFVALSICLENIHPSSFKFLEELSTKDWRIVDNTNAKENYEKKGLLFSAGIGFSYIANFTVTQLGRDLFEFGIKYITKKSHK